MKRFTVILWCLFQFLLAAWAELASGVSGTCRWVIDDDDELLFTPLNGKEGTLDRYDDFPQWIEHSSKVRKVRFVGCVKAQKCTFMFLNFDNMVEADLKGLNTEDVEDVTFMFSHCSRLEALDLSDQDLSNVREALGMFQNCERLRSIRFGQKGPITKKTIDVSGMFEGCRRLENLDLRFCDFSGVSRMARLFRDCKSLQSLTLGKFSMKQVKGQPSSTGVSKNGQELTVNLYYGNLFYGCKRLTRIEVQARTPGQVVPDAFDSFSGIDQCVLIVPKGSRKRFCKAQGWSAFKTIQEYL